MKRNEIKRFITIVVVIYMSSVVGYSQVSASDSLALVSLYNSTDGANWINKTNWLSGAVGTWYGIKLKNGRVFEVKLSNNNLNGTIPSQVGDLKHVRLLWLDNNSLTGGIPAEISTIDSLREVILSYNQLSGSIPSGLGTHPTLLRIWFNHNSLSGTVPSDLFSANKIAKLGLNNNQLTSLPSTYSTSSKIIELYLQNNSFGGGIPSEIGNMKLLKQLWLDNCGFTGNIPSSLLNLTAMQYLGLSNNNLTGSIPDFGAAMTGLIWMFANNNSFDAVSGITKGSKLEYYDISGNNMLFPDVIPYSLGNPAYLLYSPQDSVNSTEYHYPNTGTSLSLSISLSESDANDSFQWYKDGNPISGATATTYNIPSVSISDSGVYICRVINPSATSLSIYRRNIYVNPINIDPSVCGIYSLQNKKITSDGQTVKVILSATSSVSSGIIGFDFCVTYDPSLLSFISAVPLAVMHGGTASEVSYNKYENTTIGELNVSMYYNSGAAATKQMSGSGNVMELRFKSLTGSANKATGFNICGVTEGYETSIIAHCYTPGEPTTQGNYSGSLPTYVYGSMWYWGNKNKKIYYDSLYTPESYVSNANSDCEDVGNSVLPDNTARFLIKVDGNPKLNIYRDLSGTYGDVSCTDISGDVTSGDMGLIATIAAKSLNFTPNVYNIISSDVNMDGYVRANDATLAGRRLSNKICEYPQAWNYYSGSPTEKSLDWLFFDAIMINDAAFKIDPSYPNSSGSGYSRDAVPSVNQCVAIPNTTLYTYKPVIHGILLGDVNGSWTEADAPNYRGTNSNEDEDLLSSIDNNDEMNSKQIRIYPNPAQGGEFFIDINEENFDRIDIIDLYGKTIFSGIISGERNLKVSLEEYSKGVYNVRLSNENNIVVKRISLL